MNNGIPLVDQRTGFLASALWYAASGFAVMPLEPGTNMPHRGLGSGYTKTPGPTFIGTTDLGQVAAWWSQWPAANIGVVAGVVSKLVVIDCDGPTGVDNFHQWCQVNGVDLDGVPYETTPSRGGGRHYFFTTPDNTRGFKSGDWMDGVEVKADGFHVAVAPSVRQLVIPSTDPKSPKGDAAVIYIQYEMSGDLIARPMVPLSIETDFYANGGRYSSHDGSSRQSSLEGIEHYIENGLPMGCRDNSCLALARSLLNRTNGDLNAVRSMIRAVWEQTPQPPGDPFPWRQAEKCIRQAQDYYRSDLASMPPWRG